MSRMCRSAARSRSKRRMAAPSASNWMRTSWCSSRHLIWWHTMPMGGHCVESHRWTMNKDQAVSSYLQYLPAIFHQDPFIGRFLLAFEAVLSGPGYADQAGLEQLIGDLPAYVDPQTTPEEFLPWLAGWVALSLRADWDADTKRR